MSLLSDLRGLVAVACVLGSASAALAQANIPLTISGDQATGTIQLPGGVGADLSITFEDVVGLNPTALGVSAALVDPLDPVLLARLGGGGSDRAARRVPGADQHRADAVERPLVPGDGGGVAAHAQPEPDPEPAHGPAFRLAAGARSGTSPRPRESAAIAPGARAAGSRSS